MKFDSTGGCVALFFPRPESIHFPAGKSANILRGAFGTIFRKLPCQPDCPSARVCAHRAHCSYARIFEPGALEKGGPSGLADHPRPFVFRAMHLDGKTFAPGEAFSFEMYLFDRHADTVARLITAFELFAIDGLGPHRAKVRLANWWVCRRSRL